MDRFEDLERLWRESPPPPRTRGTVRLICLRKGGGVHEWPERASVTVERGLEGDRWSEKPGRDPAFQVTLMSARIAELVAGSQARPGDAGDNILVDLDLSEQALPAGARLAIGSALLEVSEKPHTGCKRFRERFGADALLWVNEPRNRGLRLRGVNCRVLAGGTVAVGDRIEVLRGDGAGPAIDTVELVPERWCAFEALLGAARGCGGCWCLNHHIQPGAPDVTGEVARVAKRARVEAGRAHGVLALDRGEPAGWCAVDRRADIPGHDMVGASTGRVDGSDTWAIHCFFVRPESRGLGLMSLLLDHAERVVRERRGRRIEAYPCHPAVGRGDLDFAGYLSFFTDRGYRRCGPDRGPYSPVAKDLAPDPGDGNESRLPGGSRSP